MQDRSQRLHSPVSCRLHGAVDSARKAAGWNNCYIAWLGHVPGPVLCIHGLCSQGRCLEQLLALLGHFYTFPGPVLWFRTCTDRARKPVGCNSRYAVKPFVDKAILSIFVPGLLKNHPALPTGWLESSHAGVKAVWPILNPSGLF